MGELKCGIGTDWDGNESNEYSDTEKIEYLNSPPPSEEGCPKGGVVGKAKNTYESYK